MGLDLVELFMAVEDEFGIPEIQDTLAVQLTTPGLLAGYVSNYLRQQGRLDCQDLYDVDANILKRVILITSERLGIPADKIKPNHTFVEDLGCG